MGLDNFKAYNTTLGHASGDTLLRRLAEVLRDSLRESDTLARWGGDQFALLVQDLGDEPAHAARGAEQPQRRDLTISVNVSPVQFRQAGFVDSVREILARSGADPRHLVLEVTESLFLQDPELARDTMLELSALGVRFALDDFGTGYSSLGYLKRLPLDELKIDQSFVRDLLESSADAAIVETIIALADRLGMRVIAEGVETEEQANWLREHGCRRFQGYLYARPAPLEKAMARSGG